MRIFIDPHKSGIVFGVCEQDEFDIRKVKWNKHPWDNIREFVHSISQILTIRKDLYEKKSIEVNKAKAKPKKKRVLGKKKTS